MPKKHNLETTTQLVFLIIIYFSAIIHYYIVNTTMLIEIILVINIMLYFMTYRFIGSIELTEPKRNYLIVLLPLSSITTIIYGILLGGRFQGETYRTLTLTLLLFSIMLLKLDYSKILKYILFICKITVFLNIIEIVYINIIIAGNFDNHILSGMFLTYFEEKESYFQLIRFPLSDYFYIRPFGMLISPNRSSFIFCIGLLILYFIKNGYLHQKNIKSNYTITIWALIFLLSTLSSGGTTSLILSVIIFSAIIMHNGYLLFYLICPLLIITTIYSTVQYYISHDAYWIPFLMDFEAFINLSPVTLLFGIGFDNKAYTLLSEFGFSAEHFFLRFLAQIGIILSFINLIIWCCVFYIPKINKVDILIIISMLIMVAHYDILSSPFIIYAMSFIILSNQRIKAKGDVSSIGFGKYSRLKYFNC